VKSPDIREICDAKPGSRRPTVLIVAGEASGDLHAGHLVRALRERRPTVRVLAAGGPSLAAAGAEMVADLVSHSVVGIAEVAGKLGTFSRLFRALVSLLRRERPDAVVLVDFPDFNMRLGRQAKEEGIPVVYYVSPQVWGWRPGRIKDLARMVRKMLVIFEFEEALYRKHGVDVEFVGHPLLDTMPEAIDAEGLRRRLRIGREETLIGLLPGSRSSVVRRHIPILRGVVDVIRAKVPEARFVVAGVTGLPAGTYDGFEGVCPVVTGHTREVLKAADLAIAASGTVTVEAAVLGTPLIVFYRVNPVTYAIVIPLVKVRNFAMVNLLAGREIAPEFLQYKATPERIGGKAVEVLQGGRLPAMRAELAEVRTKLGGAGASGRAADAILKVMETAR
jgi:lipid-A-disaccharide synthase